MQLLRHDDWFAFSLVLAKARELGLTPSRSGQALRTGRTYLVGLWIPHLQTQFSGSVVGQMQQHLNSRGFDVIVRNVDAMDSVPDYSHRNSPWAVEGVLIVDPPEGVIESLKDTMGRDMPVVNMGGNYVTSIDYVGIDNYWGAAKATEHLVKDAGCRKIAFALNEASVTLRRTRYEGVINTARDLGVEVTPLILKNGTMAEAWHATNEYLASHGYPDGVFCSNDSIALAVQSALLRHGIKIPDETAMVGCDGLEFTEFLPVTLTTLELPTSEMCEKAFSFLLNRIEQKSLPKQEAVIKPRLIVRESSSRTRR